MKIPLKKAVSEHVNGKSLDAKRLDELRALQERHGNRERPQGQLAWRRWSLAAALFVAFAAFQWLPLESDADKRLAVVKEVVDNHLKMKPLEVETAEFTPVRNYFTELDFVPRETIVLADTASLVGGRYCSIRGVTAAQLRLAEDDGDLQSLYQVTYDADKHGALPNVDDGGVPVETYARGVKVQLWVEKGILFALTGT